MATGSATLTTTNDVIVNQFGVATSTSAAASISGNLVMASGPGTNNVMQQFIVSNSFSTLNVSASISELQASSGFVPGLREGRLAGAGTYTGANPATSSNLYPRMAETFNSATPGSPWGAGETWVYTGQFFDADGVVSFGSAIDDGAFLSIDGVTTAINYTGNTTVVSGVLNIGMGPLSDGWHNIDFRVENNTGGAGSAVRNGWFNGTSGLIGSGFGFGIAPNGTADINATSYLLPIDNGTMNLFRTAGTAVPYTLTKSGPGTLILTGANTYTGATTVTAGRLIFDGAGSAATTSAVTLAAGTTLVLDNTTTNNANRINDTATVTLSGGTLYFKGNASTASTETVGALVLTANTASILRSDYGGVAGQSLSFTASSGSVLTRNTGATINVIGNDDFVLGQNDILFVATGTATAPSLTGGILPYMTITTFAGLSNEALDLAANIDSGAGFSLGRLATYDSSNVKATANVTLGATINALLIAGNAITVTVPGGGTTVSSGQIVNFGGSTGNTIAGGALAFGAVEPLLFINGINAVQKLDLNGAISGQFTLTLPINTTGAPVTGSTQVRADQSADHGGAGAATLTAASLQQALEALPAVGPGNVAVTVASGVFTITFVGLLGGGAIPQLLVNNFTVTPTPTITPIATGGGSLTLGSAITGTAALRKERKGRVTLGGDDSGFTGAIVVNEGEVVVASLTALGSQFAGTTVASGAQLTIFVPTGANVISPLEALSVAGTGYLNGDTGAVRVTGGGTLAYPGLMTNTAANTTLFVDTGTTFILRGGEADTAGFNWIKEGTGTLELRNDSYFAVFTYAPATTGTLTVPLNFDDATALDAKNGAAAGNVNFFGIWSGTLTVSAADFALSNTWTFGTSSDDGSIVLIDLNNDGLYSLNERIVNNNFMQGDTARTGNVTFPAAGTYRIAVIYYQAGGGAAMEAKFAKTANVAYASMINFIDPANAGQSGLWKDEGGTANQLTEKWISRTPVVADLDPTFNFGAGGNGLYVNSGTVRLNMQGTSTVNKHVFVGKNDGGPNAAKLVNVSTGGRPDHHRREHPGEPIRPVRLRRAQ